MSLLRDLSRYNGFTFGDNNEGTVETPYQKRLGRRRVPINSTVKQRGMGMFKKLVNDAMQQDNDKDVNRKYTYTRLIDSDSLGHISLHQALLRGDDPVDKFIGMGVQVIYIKMQYYCKMDWRTENPNKAVRLLVAQWLNNRKASDLAQVLMDDSVIDVNAEKWICSHKNVNEMDNFEVLADHVKLAKPVRGTGFGAANPVTSLYCVGEIYISGKPMSPILLSQTVDGTSGDLDPIRGKTVLYFAPENGADADAQILTLTAEMCYTDKI